MLPCELGCVAVWSPARQPGISPWHQQVTRAGVLPHVQVVPLGIMVVGACGLGVYTFCRSYFSSAYETL